MVIAPTIIGFNISHIAHIPWVVITSTTMATTSGNIIYNWVVITSVTIAITLPNIPCNSLCGFTMYQIKYGENICHLANINNNNKYAWHEDLIHIMAWTSARKMTINIYHSNLCNNKFITIIINLYYKAYSKTDCHSKCT